MNAKQEILDAVDELSTCIERGWPISAFGFIRSIRAILETHTLEPIDDRPGCSYEDYLEWKKEWRPVDGFDRYLVSSKGEVRHKSSGLALSESISKITGYKYVMLHPGKKYTTVHSIVARAFLGCPPADKTQVNHKNCDKCDNRVENLEWVSPKENTLHAIENERFCMPTGQRCPVAQIEKNTGAIIHVFPSIADAARSIAVPHSNISMAVNRDRRTAGGYKWRSV